MSSHYNTEPPPTASATLHTTAGPIHISLFAQQAPLACKNFLQHCLDGYYNGTIFHRIVSDFIIQGGDPTGTGAGGSSIYEDDEEAFGIDPKTGEKVVFGDEIHSRLKFNRRGLLGMAKSEVGGGRRRGGAASTESPYGSQFFITLANAERELNGTCTMFGRLEGESIYNVVKIAEGELVQGTDRPAYAVRVTSCEVGDLGPFTGVLSKRDKVAKKKEQRDDGEVARKKQERKIKKKKDAKTGKALLSFGAEEGEDDSAIVASEKPKFNTKLVTAVSPLPGEEEMKKKQSTLPTKPTKSTSPVPPKPHKRPRSPSAASHSPPAVRRKPQVPDPHKQLPLPDEENPSRSPSPSTSEDESPRQTALSRTNAEIASLKASMRRDIGSGPAEYTKKKSALEAMIPKTSIRGRKRPPPGGATSNGSGLSGKSKDNEALKMFNAFKARLEGANTGTESSQITTSSKRSSGKNETSNGDVNASKSGRSGEDENEDEEAQLCDLHFIVNCQSCQSWTTDDKNSHEKGSKLDASSHGNEDEDDPRDWMTHVLTFGKDTLGKDLSWKREHADDADGLVVFDPREKEREIVSGKRSRKRERELKQGKGGEREWDRERDRK
jgi:peptidyl-prolyl cis-trans isomerase SDCCAG10